MKIHYVEDSFKNKLFSFFRHDFNMSTDGTFIDGGFDYIRTNADVQYNEISDLIEDIREQFIWKSTMNPDGTVRDEISVKYLKDLDIHHIINILIYFINLLTEDTKIITSWMTIHSIFLEELKYRLSEKCK